MSISTCVVSCVGYCLGMNNAAAKARLFNLARSLVRMNGGEADAVESAEPVGGDVCISVTSEGARDAIRKAVASTGSKFRIVRDFAYPADADDAGSYPSWTVVLGAA